MGFTPVGEEVSSRGFTPIEAETPQSGFIPLEGKKPLRGQTDAPVDQDASWSGALAKRITTLPETLIGGTAEMAGDQLATEKRGYGEIALEGLRTALKPGQGVSAFVDTAGAMAKKFSGAGDDELSKNLSGFGAEVGDAAREERRIATPTDLNILQRAGLSAADSTIQMAPWLALGRGGIGRGAVRAGFVEGGALGQFGASAFSNTYNEAKAHGATPEDAFKAAVISGGAEVITEKLGMDVLLKEGSKKFGKFLARELGGEEIATIVQSLSEKGLYNPEKWSSPQEVLADLAETALAAGMGAGAIRGIDKYALERLEAKKGISAEQQEAARKELEKSLIEATMNAEREQAAAATGTLPVKVSPLETAIAMAGPDIGKPLTPEEEQQLKLEEAQRSGVISQAPTPETLAYAAGLDAAVSGTHAQSPGQQAAVDKAAEALGEAAQDFGGTQSPEVLARKAETLGEYTSALPISKRGIGLVEGLAADQQVEGLTIEQLGPTPAGSVVVPDWNQEAVPLHAAKAITQTVHQWVQKYLPNARVVLNFEQLGEGEYGWHQLVEGPDGITTHIINPMEFPSAKYGGDAKTVTSLITALSHEFGHALYLDSLSGQLDRALGGKGASAPIMREIMQGQVSPESLAALQAKGGVEAKMITEWQTMRQRVLDGTMTAKEFMDSWAGMRKMGVDVGKTPTNQRRYTWAEQQLGKDIEAASALDLVQAVAGTDPGAIRTYLSLNEYAAEQFSRYAYAKGDVTDSAYGRWFTDAMNKLKSLFVTLKAEKIIAPNVSFAEWVDSTRAYNKKHAMKSGNKARKWGLTPELLAKREQVLGLRAEMKAAEEELKREAEAAKKKAEEAKQVKAEVKEKAAKKETRTKKDVAKAAAVEVVGDEVVTLYSLMIEVQGMTLAEREALLKKYPKRTAEELQKLGGSASEAQDYLAKRQMIEDAVMQARADAGRVDAPVQEVQRTNAFGGALAAALGKPAPAAEAPVETPAPAKGKMGSKRTVKAKKEAAPAPVVEGEEAAPTTEVAPDDLAGEAEVDTEDRDALIAASEEVKTSKGRKKVSFIGQTKVKLTADSADKHAELTAMLDEFSMLMTDQQIESIQKQLDVGQLEAAEKRLMKIANSQVSYDRDVSSKALKAMPKKRDLFARTQLEQVLKAAGYRKTELEFWQNFMLLHPEGFTREMMVAALTERQLPLVEHVFSVPGNNMVNWGVHSDGLGYDPNGEGSQYNVTVASWQLPKEYRTAPDIHWSWATDNSMMHSRRLDIGALRYVLELQSAYYQAKVVNRPDVTIRQGNTDSLDAKQLQERIQSDQDYVDWLKTTSAEELAQNGIANPAADIADMEAMIAKDQQRLEMLETPEDRAKREALGATALPRVKQQMANLEPRWAEDLVEREVGSAFESGKAEVLFPTPETADKIQGWDLLEPGTPDWEKVQGSRRRYRELRAYITRQYNAVQVSDVYGNSWLSVIPADFGNTTVSFDRDNPLNTESLPLVTHSAAAGLEGSTVQDGLAQWDAHRTGSPMFRRWFGASQVTTPDGLAQHVWRSMGQRITQANSAIKGYWFSAVPAVGYSANGVRTVEDKAAQRVGQFFLKIENPLVVEADGQIYDEERLEQFTKDAYLAGHDGLIIRDMGGVQASDHFVVFSLDQAVSNVDVPSVEEEDTVNWDRDSTSQAVKGVFKGLKKFDRKMRISARVGRNYAKLADNLVQIQQRAHTSPGEVQINRFAKLQTAIQEFKNKLQAEADGFVKQDIQLLSRTDPAIVAALEKLLRYEATVDEEVGKEAEQFGTPVYRLGENVLNPNGERLSQNMLVIPGLEVKIEIGPKQKAELATWANVWLGWTDQDAAKLDTLVNRYETARTIIAGQMLTLGQSLAKNAIDRFGGHSKMARADIAKTVDAIAPLIHQPFTPQGHFGNYVLLVTDKAPGATFGPGPKRVTIRREHFESKDARDAAYAHWVKVARGQEGLKVVQKDITDDDKAGLPLQLPANLLERIAATEEFTEKQLELMGELLVSTNVSKIADRFKAKSTIVDGSSTDLTRTFADFTWRNSNYIWKVHFGHDMRQIIKAAKAEVRELQRDAVNELNDIAEIQKTIDWKNRNIGLMEAAKQYMLNPPNEYQGLRTVITMVYLAYNVKTLFMNFSTNMNTYVGVTARLGEIAGHKAYGRAVKDAAMLLSQDFMAKRKKQDVYTNATVAFAQGEMTAEEYELYKLLERAVQEGVLDQSYAYYLAAHANQNLANAVGGKSGKIGTAINRGGQIAHLGMEWGMYGFQFVEKTNRLISLFAFYDVAKQEGLTGSDAYQEAVRQTNLLQNDYSAGNRPKIMRGGKALFTIFQGYAQFMGWIMTGKYEKGERQRAQAEGRYYQPAYRGPTVKLWLMYLALAGYMGVPFAQNLMDLAQWMWRKMTGRNLDAEIREFIREMGMDANLVQHGLLHNFFGMDLSGSLGLGRLFPGTDTMSKRSDTAAEFFGNLMFSLTGVFGNTGRSGFEMYKVWDKGGSAAEIASKAPGVSGYIGKSLDAYARQSLRPGQGAGVVTKGDARVIWDKRTQQFRDLYPAEIGVMLLGANPTARAEGMQRNFAAVTERMYWEERRADLTERYNRAKMAGDADTMMTVRQDITAYNSQVPNSSMKLTGASLAKSYNTHRQNARKIEQYGTTSKKLRSVVGDVREEY